MLPFKIIYHGDYDLRLGTHVFPSQKFRLVHEALLAEGIAEPADFLAPQPASDKDVLLVHAHEYVRNLKNGTLSAEEIQRMEIPYSPMTVKAFWLAAGGTILAARRALADGWAVNLTGGFHHAYPAHGEGFCMIHDVAIAIRRMQSDGAIQTAMVVDTDVHQGNGTAAIFRNDPGVFTLSLHQENNYPYPKPASTMDVNLEDGTGDDEYLAALDGSLTRALRAFSPGLLFHVAGADPYREDQLGGLALTMEGLQRRDAMVYEHARLHGVPVAMTLAGGYARQLDDTVRIHVNTICAMRHAAQASPAPE